MKDNIVNIGIVGAGKNATAVHIPHLQSIPGVTIGSICNRHRSSSERVAQQFNVPQIYDCWKDLVVAKDTNAIMIGTWPYLHCQVTLAALAANKHVLCEARMAMTALEAHQMLEAARSKPDLITQLVPSPVTLAVDKKIQQLISEDYLGKLLVVEIRDCTGFTDPEAPLHWRQDFNLSGFNTLSLGIWYEALMRWMGEATNVLAQGKTFVASRKDSAGNMQAVRVPDHLGVLADMACGAQLNMQLSSVERFGGQWEVSIFGSQGTLRLSKDKLLGAGSGDSELKEIPILPHEQGRWQVEEEFIQAIRGERSITTTTFEDGVKYMEFTEAVARSAASGKTVSLPLDLSH